MSLSAMQLILITVNEVESSSLRMVLTRAVLPVPGEPEMYRDEEPFAEFDSMKEVMNSIMIVCSLARPDTGEFPLEVERNNARARTWSGVNELDGVGGGVASVR